MNLSDWFAMIRAYAQRQEGQTMAEYGVVLAVITIGVVVAIGLLNVVIEGKFTDVGTMIVQLVPG
jgi:Flp pilus assembly pilin Flp